jgi:hypothetical protein
MTQKEKTKFRASSKWKKFRVFMKKLFEGKDAITGKPLYKGWNLHHLDEKNYSDLKPEKFIPLNKKSHEMLHFLERYDNYEEVAANLVKYVKIMKENKEK